jgi:lipopolysaccharide export system protein LptC
MTVELHLPDLPEVPIALGPLRPAAHRRATPWHLRLRDALSSYLPLLLMALLALGTWWLVKNTPLAPKAPPAEAVRSDPDYTMTNFVLERFDPSGRLRLRVQGDRLRHFPDSDRMEIDNPQFRAFAPDGSVTVAGARRALSNGDLSEVQLLGSAEVHRQGPPAVVIRGEFLHAFLVNEQVRSHLPVRVTQGRNEWQAAGVDYDHGQRKLEFKGPMHAVLGTGPVAR